MEPLSYYFGDNPAIDRLADDYGDRLERMATAHKLLSISILSGVLYKIETSPLEECSITDYTVLLHTLDSPDDASLCNSLKDLDDCEPSTIATLVMAIAIYAAQEVK